MEWGMKPHPGFMNLIREIRGADHHQTDTLVVAAAVAAVVVVVCGGWPSIIRPLLLVTSAEPFLFFVSPPVRREIDSLFLLFTFERLQSPFLLGGMMMTTPTVVPLYKVKNAHCGRSNIRFNIRLL
jgi:hypothetical protein